MSKQTEFLSTQTAAKLLGVSLRTVQLWVESGVLKAWKTAGGHRRILRNSVDSLLAEKLALKSAYEQSEMMTILLIDDDKLIAEYFKLHIQQWYPQARIEIAADGLEGLVKAGRFAPEIVVVDLIMPKLDGFALIEALNDHMPLPQNSIIVITNLNEQERKAKGHLPNEIQIVEKSASIENLHNALRVALGTVDSALRGNLTEIA